MIKNYKFGVDIYSLLLFLIIMLPNFIWFAIPAPNDILRTDSVTPIVDAIGSFCQIFFIIALCVYCTIKIPKVAEGNPKSCMRIFPIIADAFGISLRPQ